MSNREGGFHIKNIQGHTFLIKLCRKIKFHKIYGYVDEKISLKFVEHFAIILSNNNSTRTTELLAELTDLCSAYVGYPLTQDMVFNVELINYNIMSLSNGKVPGLDKLTAEHLKYAHHAIALDLAKLFNLMLNPLTAVSRGQDINFL